MLPHDGNRDQPDDEETREYQRIGASHFGEGFGGNLQFGERRKRKAWHPDIQR
jgi:hypothetical protein